MMKRIRSWLLPSLAQTLPSQPSLAQTQPQTLVQTLAQTQPQQHAIHETSIYANMTPPEKRHELIRVISTENMYKDIMNHYHEQISMLENRYKQCSSAEDKRMIRKRISSIHDDLYKCVHQWSLLKQQQDILEEELYLISSENEF